jgi:hypothetical protein
MYNMSNACKIDIINLCNKYINTNNYFIYNKEISEYKRDTIRKIIDILNNFNLKSYELINLLKYSKRNVNKISNEKLNFFYKKSSSDRYDTLLKNIHQTLISENPGLNIDIIMQNGGFLSIYKSIPYKTYILALNQFIPEFKDIFNNPERFQKLFFILFLLRDQTCATKIDHNGKFIYLNKTFQVDKKYANQLVTLFNYPESKLLYVCYKTKTIAKFLFERNLSEQNIADTAHMEHALENVYSCSAQYIFISLMKELSKNGSQNLKINLSKSIDNIPYSALLSYQHLISYIGKSVFVWAQSRTLLSPMNNESEYGSNFISILSELINATIKSLGLSYISLAKGFIHLGFSSIYNNFNYKLMK